MTTTIPPTPPTHAATLLHAGRNWTKADVHTVGDGALVLKTVTGRSRWSRCVGWISLRHEAAVLDRLRGADEVPQHARLTPEGLLMERIAGKRLYDLRKVGIDAGTAQRVEDAVRALHARGFAHGDIGRRDVVITPAGAVKLLDFATAVGRGTPPVLGSLLVPIFRWRDRVRVRRMLERYRHRYDDALSRRRVKGS